MASVNPFTDAIYWHLEDIVNEDIVNEVFKAMKSSGMVIKLIKKTLK